MLYCRPYINYDVYMCHLCRAPDIQEQAAAGALQPLRRVLPPLLAHLGLPVLRKDEHVPSNM